MGHVVGWVLSFADAETQEGFFYALGVATRISADSRDNEKGHPRDRETARFRLAKLEALRQEGERGVQNARDLDEAMQRLLRDLP